MNGKTSLYAEWLKKNGMSTYPAEGTEMPPKQRILDGIKSHNEPAEWNGNKGFWVQADCAFEIASTATYAIELYRRDLANFDIGCSHNLHCDALKLQVPGSMPSAEDDKDKRIAELEEELRTIRTLTHIKNPLIPSQVTLYNMLVNIHHRCREVLKR